MEKTSIALLVVIVLTAPAVSLLPFHDLDIVKAESEETASALTYPVIDTGQTKCYNNSSQINAPGKGKAFYGQDAQHDGIQFSYLDNSDGTISDLNTGLTWQKSPAPGFYNWNEALVYAENLKLAGYSDWRLPTIKELLSIVAFWGGMPTQTPYIDTDYFDFEYPAASTGLRDMDAQYWSSNRYVGTTMRGDNSAFGFNFADGRIKSYPITSSGGPKSFSRYVRCVRGNNGYGKNDFVNNGDKTITDAATGLMWMKSDSGTTMNWEDALAYAGNLKFAGYGDWRLPNAKELQSIVDYSRAPDASSSKSRGPAIDPIFNVTITESWYWSSTTLGENTSTGIYISFGQAYSEEEWNGSKMNAHGAGALRSDPKNGDPDDYANGRGPQSDEIRIYNYVRCVRDADISTTSTDLASVKTRVNKSQVDPGSSLTVKALIRNKGKEKSVATTVSFYLSPKNKITNKAVLLGTADVKALAAGKKKWVRLRAQLDDDVKAGSYYIVSYVDEPDRNSDPVSSNNTSARRITIY